MLNVNTTKITIVDETRECLSRQTRKPFNIMHALVIKMPTCKMWLGGRVVRTLDLRSVGREFESWPLRYLGQPWASC